MIKTKENLKPGFDTAIGRWAGVGPYYAMFPVDFAFEVVNKYCKKGGHILDPFAGRASSIYAAAALGRKGDGIEINPVAWIYGKAKLSPASQKKVLKRLEDIEEFCDSCNLNENQKLPKFFSCCFSKRVLKFLLTARNTLDWKNNSVDRTLMAFILIYLHGKKGQALSNQMRQTKSMAPDYSIKWWASKKFVPPKIDPVEFLKQRIVWRYLKGAPSFNDCHVYFGDSTQILKRKISNNKGRYDLLFTSPPYCGLTNYHYDQWLRLWMLGGANRPTAVKGEWRSRFSGEAKYKMLLNKVFENCAPLMTKDSVIYIRTYASKVTFNATINALRTAFPHKMIRTVKKPFYKDTQTVLFGDKSRKPGEIDIILQ